MSLPGETANRKAIARWLAVELAQCKQLLQFGVELPDPAVLNRHQLGDDTMVAVMGLFTKACISYRAIILLGESGLDLSTAPVNRSLFETFLNLSFLLRRRVSLYTFDFGDTITRKPFDLFGRKLDVHFRTDLYWASSLLRDEKMVKQWARTPGLKRTGKDANRCCPRFRRHMPVSWGSCGKSG